MVVALDVGSLNCIFYVKMESFEDDDQYMNEDFEDEDYGDFSDGFGSNDDDGEEVIDYEEMKRDLEMFQNVGGKIIILLFRLESSLV